MKNSPPQKVSVKDMVLSLLKSRRKNDSYESIAAKVRKELKSNTTASNIRWYAWKYSFQEIEQKRYQSGEDIDILLTGNLEKDAKLGSKGENYVKEKLEKEGYKVVPAETSENGRHSCGFDLIATKGKEVRHIEVKTRRNRRYFELTPNEFSQFEKDRYYWVYFVYIHEQELEVFELSRSYLKKNITVMKIGRVTRFGPAQKQRN